MLTYKISELEPVKVADDDLFENENNKIKGINAKRFLNKINFVKFNANSNIVINALNSFSDTAYNFWNEEMLLYNESLLNYISKDMFHWNTEMKQYNEELGGGVVPAMLVWNTEMKQYYTELNIGGGAVLEDGNNMILEDGNNLIWD